MTARFDQQLSVPIVVTGLRAGYVARYTDKFAVVTIDATRNGPPVKPDQIRAVLNLSANPDPGVFSIPVQIIAPDLQIRSLVPAFVTLSLDRLEERTVPVSIAYGAGAHNIVVESVGVNPSLVTLRGIATELARAQAVRVDIPMPSKAASVDAMVRPLAVNAAGDEIATLQVSPNLVRVRARFVQSTATGAGEQ